LELDVGSVLDLELDVRSVLRFEPDGSTSFCLESETRSALRFVSRREVKFVIRSFLELKLDIRSAGGGVGLESEFVEAADVLEVLEVICLDDWLRC
jgi:hypothetical protein